MGRFQLESIYLCFPPSSQLVYLCINILAGTTVENKGKLIPTVIKQKYKIPLWKAKQYCCCSLSHGLFPNKYIKTKKKMLLWPCYQLLSMEPWAAAKIVWRCHQLLSTELWAVAEKGLC